MAENSVSRIVQLLDLMRDIGERRDVKGVITAVSRRYAMLFGDYDVLAIVLTNQACDCWRCFVLPNPSHSADSSPSTHNTSLQHLPSQTGMEELVNSLGYDITDCVSRPTLHGALIEQTEPFVASAHPRCEALRCDLSAMLCHEPMPRPALMPSNAAMPATELKTVLAASQPRPLERGRLWVFLGFREPLDVSDELLTFYDATIEMTSRMTGYLSLYNEITRLEHLNQSVRRNLVHDLKTPLTVIKGCADTLQHLEIATDTELGRELVGDIAEQAERLLEQLQELLAPPLSSTWQPHYEEFDLVLLLHKAVMAEKHTERARHHHFVVEGVDHPLRVRADARKIRRVLENLLSNGVKYSPGADKTVRISLSVQHGQVTIAVHDEGLGMTPDQLHRVLQAPGRVADANRNIEGSGFGLDSCRQVLQAHGGSLQAESCCGQGSTFTAVLPLAPHEECVQK
jgi:signal transduction histidine kinase